MTLVLGIDVGITGARAAIVDRSGQLVARGRSKTKWRQARQVMPRDWPLAVIGAVRDALRAAGSIKIEAIGIGALGPCPILLDAQLEPIGDAPVFSTDSAAEDERHKMLSRHGLTEYELGPDHVLPRLQHWQRTEPERIAKARVVVDVAGYLGAWLTGTPAMDPATRHDHVARGLPQPVPLPTITPATHFAGGLTAEAAERLGLPADTPVTTGGYDSYVDLFGAGVRREGEAGLLLGSTLVLGRVWKTSPDAAKLAMHGLRATPYISALGFCGGWTSASGSLVDWAEQLTPGEHSGIPLPLPGRHGLLALPYFAGERAPIWDPHACGAIIGPTLDTTPADLHRALGEAIALSTLDIGDRLAAALGPIAGYRVAGGGVQNPVWAQDTADALGVPLDIVAHAGEAMGPALLALAALGHEVEPHVARTIRADPRRHDRYRELLELYRRLYPALKDTMHKLSRMAGKETS